jgi:hypothetical protein
MANDKPTPKIGDINGDISIAPIMTAVELVSKPIEASTVEHISIHRLYPRSEAPSLMLDFVLSKSVFPLRPEMFWRYLFKKIVVVLYR